MPGNVRELRNVIEPLAILAPGQTIDAEDIQLGTPSSSWQGRS